MLFLRKSGKYTRLKLLDSPVGNFKEVVNVYKNKINENAIKLIEELLSNGKDVLLQCRKDGIVIVEQSKKIVNRIKCNEEK